MNADASVVRRPQHIFTLFRYIRAIVSIVSLVALCAPAARAQFGWEPGHPIGTVTVRGKLILLTLNEGALGHANLFDLAHHTLRFTPDGSGYRVEQVPFVWDSDFGAALTSPQVKLKNFAFPFSGKTWTSLSVGVTGSIVFGQPPTAAGPPRRRGVTVGRAGGLSVARFAELRDAASEFVNTVPAISVFFKPRMSGTRYLKELDDRAVISWSLTEPYGNIQDWSWTPTVNKFQAVLHKDGTIDLSYDDIHARDAVVGIYPLVSGNNAKEITTVSTAGNPSAAPNLDIRSIHLSAVDGLYLKVGLEGRGRMLAGTDPAIAGIAYFVCLDRKVPVGGCQPGDHNNVVWTVRGFGERTRGSFHMGPRYFAYGTGLSPRVSVEANTLSMQGILPEGYAPGEKVYISAAVQATESGTLVQIAPHAFKLADVASPAVHFSSLRKNSGPYPVVFEAFHYLKPPRAQDLTCSVIKALGDKFDMLAYYSDFRIDNPEAGTSSDGPLGGGPNGKVTGIGAEQGNLAAFCSKGRFQWQFIQPVYVGSNQMQEYPPDNLKGSDPHDIAFYQHQLAERTFNGKIPPYDYAMSQIGHEMGHRWAAFVQAKVNGETIELGPTHWAMGLQAPVAFPYQRPTEASAMGGGVWQDNFDGTYTQLDDNYYVPATGYSYLDLYLMGMIAPSEVPDFFILRNLVPAGKDANGHRIFKADRTKITIQDVIAAEGPRLPDVDHAQKHFNTGMVMVVEHGKAPSPELIERTNGIRERWMDYWTTVTGHRSTMTTEP